VPRIAWRPLCLLPASLLATGLVACGSDQEPVTVSKSEGQATQARVTEAPPPLPVTRNTSRIGGTSPPDIAAGAALATHPRFAGAKPIEAAAIVNAESWQAGVAAAQLAGPPLNLPILLSEPGSVPDSTSQTLDVLNPQGGSGPGDTAAYKIDGAQAPDGLASSAVGGDGPAGIAVEIDKLRQRLTGTSPEHVLLVSEQDPGYSMPAAAWSARSGDPVFFVRRDSVPDATKQALEAHKGASVYVLGPASAVSERTLREAEHAAPGVRRISAEDPVSNAIEFARYVDATFGWGITDPGHGLVIANSSRPADAGASAALSASGTYGPLLITDSATQLPAGLKDFLSSIQPGYRDDPTRALYNHVWLIGDGSAISGAMQGEIDDLAELTQIGGAQAGANPLAAPPSTGAGPEQEPAPGAGQPTGKGKAP
jgi:hypothetical protein